MGNTSYTAHISNKKSAITSKNKLLGVAKHNLRKYKSEEYSRDKIIIIKGTDDLYQDVKNVYHQEFDDVVKEYNEKQKRAERKINDYFEHVADIEQDMAVEIIFQCGDKAFWQSHEFEKGIMYPVYKALVNKLEEVLPEFKIANAVIHLDEASPHVHVVGVPVWEGAKRGLRKKVSKRNVFTPETLSVILQDKMREAAWNYFRYFINEDLSEKKLGRNHDLSVMEYKVAKERENLQQVKEEYTNKKKALEDKVQFMKLSRDLYKEFMKSDERERNWLQNDIGIQKQALQDVKLELEENVEKVKEVESMLDRVKSFMDGFKLFAPTIEDYANQVEAGRQIEAGNSFRGILYEIGKLLEAFKELLKEGLCWFPRLMKWKTSKGEVAPVFIDIRNGYDYSIVGYMNVETKEKISREEIQHEIISGNRTGTVEQMDANLDAMMRDLQEILRINAEQKRLWEEYRKWQHGTLAKDELNVRTHK